MRELLKANPPGRITFQVSLAEVLLSQKRYADARALMQEALARNPGNYPITSTLAAIEIADGNGAAAADYLRELTRRLPSQEQLC